MPSSLLWHVGEEITPSPLSLQLDIMEPKVPDDIYKTHLENNRKGLHHGLAWPWLWGVAGGPGAGRQPAGDLWGPLALHGAGSAARCGLGHLFPHGRGQIFARVVWDSVAGLPCLLPASS